jgi:WhiB family redox-sensing transcriptional regulator
VTTVARNGLGNPDVGTAHQESLEGNVDQHFKDLLEASSLGTPAAAAIRASTPADIVDNVRRRLMKREGQAARPQPTARENARRAIVWPLIRRPGLHDSPAVLDSGRRRRETVTYDLMQAARRVLEGNQPEGNTADQDGLCVGSMSSMASYAQVEARVTGAGSRAELEMADAPPEDLSAGHGFQFSMGQWPQSLARPFPRTPWMQGPLVLPFAASAHACLLCLATDREMSWRERTGPQADWPAARPPAGYGTGSIWDQATQAMLRHLIININSALQPGLDKIARREKTAYLWRRFPLRLLSLHADCDFANPAASRKFLDWLASGNAGLSFRPAAAAVLDRITALWDMTDAGSSLECLAEAAAALEVLALRDVIHPPVDVLRHLGTATRRGASIDGRDRVWTIGTTWSLRRSTYRAALVDTASQLPDSNWQVNQLAVIGSTVPIGDSWIRHESAPGQEQQEQGGLVTSEESETFWITNWTDRAACKGADPDELFVQGVAQNRAKLICRGCPVRTECLADALDNGIEFGVWGGMTERERRALLRRRPDVTSWRELLMRARARYELHGAAAEARQHEAPVAEARNSLPARVPLELESARAGSCSGSGW